MLSNPAPMEMIGQPTTGSPAPYGQSCTNCVRAKCKCVYQSGGLRCERCHRLQKECSPSVRKRRVNRGPGSRTAQLEEKLDDIVTLLRTQSSTNLANRGFNSAKNAGINTPASSTELDNSVHENNNPNNGSRDPTTTRTTTPHQQPLPPPLPSTLSSPLEPNFLEAEENLLTFRRRMLGYFPFMYIPPDMTAGQLREKSPFLWFNIMTITTTPVGQQYVLGDTIKQYIAQKMVVEHEKSLDLLQGLLVFIAWTHYYRKEKPFITVICSLAYSLVFDLGLNKDPDDINIMPFFKSHDALYNMYRRPMTAPKQKTMEERRALLGCFYVCSQVALTLKKLDALTWTPFMDECVQVLIEQAEWEGDHMLVAQVKIHLIADQLHRAPWQSTEYGSPVFFTSTLQSRLQIVKNQLSSTLQTTDTITSQLLYTELLIQETALFKSHISPNNPDLRRRQLLEAQKDTIKAWFTMFFNTQPDTHVGITFAIWTHLAHSLVSLHRLSTLTDDPAWDRAALVGDLDLFHVCDRLALRFDRASAIRRRGAGERDGDLFFYAARVTRFVRDGWLAEVGKSGRDDDYGGDDDGDGAQEEAVEEEGGFVVGSGVDLAVEGFPGLEVGEYETWLTDIFNGSWE